jgi:hypothetical protein
LSEINVLRSLFGDPDMDCAVVGEILISSNEYISLVVLEDDTLDFVQAIEILDCGYDGFRGVVWEYLDSHTEASLAAMCMFGRVWEVERKGDSFGLHTSLSGRNHFLRVRHLGARDGNLSDIHCFRMCYPSAKGTRLVGVG